MLVRSWMVDLQTFRGARQRHLGLGKVRCDRHGNAYVADAVMRVIHKFGPDGALVGQLKGTQSRHTLTNARDVAVDPTGSAFVADTGDDRRVSRIVQFDADGRWKRALMAPSPVQSIAVDRKGDLYLHCPYSEWRVQKMSSSGELLSAFGRRPAARESERPRHSKEKPQHPYELMSTIAVDGAMNTYFAPAYTYEVQRYTADGDTDITFHREIEIQQDDSPKIASNPGFGTVIVWDVSVPFDGTQLYTFLASAGVTHRGATIDVWGGVDSGFVTQLQLDDPAYSIACEPSGGIYTLYSNVPKRVLYLAKYLPA